MASQSGVQGQWVTTLAVLGVALGLMVGMFLTVACEAEEREREPGRGPAVTATVAG